MSETESVARRIPRDVWVPGFVSMLMDISSEMTRSLLALFMVTVLGKRSHDWQYLRVGCALGAPRDSMVADNVHPI